MSFTVDWSEEFEEAREGITDTVPRNELPRFVSLFQHFASIIHAVLGSGNLGMAGMDNSKFPKFWTAMKIIINETSERPDPRNGNNIFLGVRAIGWLQAIRWRLEDAETDLDKQVVADFVSAVKSAPDGEIPPKLPKRDFLEIRRGGNLVSDMYTIYDSARGIMDSGLVQFDGLYKALLDNLFKKFAATGLKHAVATLEELGSDNEQKLGAEMVAQATELAAALTRAYMAATRAMGRADDADRNVKIGLRQAGFI